MQGLIQWAFGFLAALVIVWLAVAIYRSHRWLVRSVAPAASVLLLGAALLFGTDQGRDLGSALVAATLAQRLWFVAALLYWALATWHSARFPLDRAHARWLGEPPAKPRHADGRPAGERRRRWTPRLLGGLVFVFALVHLGLAVRAGGDPRDAGVLAVIVLAMASLYALFVVYRRGAGEAMHDRLAGRAPELAVRLDAAFEPPADPVDDERLTTAVAKSTWTAFLLLLGIGLVLTAMAWSDPLAVGDRFGSMALGFVALGGFSSGLVALWMASERLGWRLPLAVGALLFVALAVSLTRHYHPARDCSELADCLAGDTLEEARPDIATAAVDWYEQARKAGLVAEDAPVPMIIVATAGGGLRAAYWTAVVLGTLPEELGLDLKTFERHFFAISGVSGGSVGAAFRTAMLPDYSDAPSLDQAVRDALSRDFLAPTLAALAFVDLPSWVLPNLGQTSRGVAMEEAFEAAAGPRLAAPFLQARGSAGDWHPLLLLNAVHQETGRRVIMSHAKIDRDPFLDSFDLHALTGADLRLSTAAHNSARFSFVSPAGRLATHPDDEDRGWIIDGGYFDNFGALTALELARAALAAIEAHTGRPDAVLPLIVQISSDPALGRPILDEAGEVIERRDLARIAEPVACGGTDEALAYAPDIDKQAGFLSGNQILAPLRGVLGSRTAHGVVASKSLARFACARQQQGLPVAYAHFAMCGAGAVPLGWVLSPGAAARIEAYPEQCDNPAALAALQEAIQVVTAKTD